MTLLLVAGWCALWRDISVANLLSGTIVAVGVQLVLGRSVLGGRPMKIVPVLKLVRLVLIDLVRSTASVAYEILTPTDHTQEAILAIAIPSKAHHLMLPLTVMITLTPGTAVIETDPIAGNMYLHLLHHDQRQETVRHVERLAELLAAAFPAPTGQRELTT